LAAELKSNFNTDATLFAEGKGIFDVIVDGELLFSKYKLHRFPEPEEVTDIIRHRQG
jgi:selT/selW/selH-like putative selenoprotein